MQDQDLPDLSSKVRDPSRRGSGQERDRDLPEGEEPLLLRGFRPRCSAGLVRPAAAVVLIDDAGLTRCHERVVGDDLAGERLEYLHPVLEHADEHRVADQAVRHRVASRSEPHARQLVHFAG